MILYYKNIDLLQIHFIILQIIAILNYILFIKFFLTNIFLNLNNLLIRIICFIQYKYLIFKKNINKNCKETTFVK